MLIESSWASEYIQSKNDEESKSEQFAPPIWKIKLSRKHLSMDQKEWITNLFTINNKSRSEISHELFLSYSTVWRILREGKYDEVKRNCKNSSYRGSCKLDLYTKKFITDYVQNTDNPFCLKNIQHYLLTERDIEAKITDISSFINNKLHLSYKRCSSHSSQIDIARLKAQRKIYVMEFSNIVDNTKFLVNIDEVIFSKSTKINYSWIRKGRSKFWNNISFSGSLSLIWAITSNGDWFASNLITTHNSKTFVEYISQLMKWLTEDLKIAENRIVMILDNSPVHKSKISLERLNELGWRIWFLSAYSPDFVPIELLFNTLKRRISIQEKGKIVRLNKNEGLRAIKECLSTINRNEIKSYWIVVMKNILQEISLKNILL